MNKKTESENQTRILQKQFQEMQAELQKLKMQQQTSSPPQQSAWDKKPSADPQYQEIRQKVN